MAKGQIIEGVYILDGDSDFTLNMTERYGQIPSILTSAIGSMEMINIERGNIQGNGRF